MVKATITANGDFGLKERILILFSKNPIQIVYCDAEITFNDER